jgi:hypothetical protein
MAGTEPRPDGSLCDGTHHASRITHHSSRFTPAGTAPCSYVVAWALARSRRAFM